MLQELATQPDALAPQGGVLKKSFPDPPFQSWSFARGMVGSDLYHDSNEIDEAKAFTLWWVLLAHPKQVRSLNLTAYAG
jgi:hypothetical protein